MANNAYLEAVKYNAEKKSVDPAASALSQIATAGVKGYYEVKKEKQKDDAEFQKELFKQYLNKFIPINMKTGLPLDAQGTSVLYVNWRKNGVLPGEDDGIKWEDKEKLQNELKSAQEISKYEQKRKIDKEMGFDPYGRAYSGEAAKRAATKANPLPKDKIEEDKPLFDEEGEETVLAPNEEERKSGDRIAIFDKNTKQFIRWK